MSDAASPQGETTPFPVARTPHIGKPRVDEWQLGETGALDHRGIRYRVSLVADDTWVIRSEDGRTMGSVHMLSPAGEEGEPVYGVRRPGSDETDYEGTDWRSLTAAVINEVLDAEDEAAEAEEG